MKKLFALLSLVSITFMFNSVSFAQEEEIIEEDVRVVRTVRTEGSAAGARSARGAAASGARSARGAATGATAGARSARSARGASGTTAGARSARGAATGATAGARSARSARGASGATARSARSAAGATVVEGGASSARSARSARGTTGASTARSARSAAGALVAGGTSSARSARSARGTTGASTARSARTGTTVGGTSAARSGVSRMGAATAAAVGVGTTTTTTSTTTNYSDLVSSTETVTAKTKEEVATQMANEDACKTQFTKCMDTYCQDTADDSVIGRCLCSGSIVNQSAKEKELNKVVANINQLQWQTKNLDTAKAQADAEGKDFATVLKEVTAKELEELGVTNESLASEQDIFEVFMGDVSKNSVRKEGDALFKQAQKNCETALELCPESKSRVVESYSTLAGNDCRTYSRDLDAKIFEKKVVQQNAYNQYQMKDTEYSLKTKNKFNAEQCSTDLNRCMKDEAVCGINLEYCYSDAELEAKKPLCKSVLNQCQGVNMPTLAKGQVRDETNTDVLWKAFKKNTLARSQLSTQQCFEQSMSCVKTACGEDLLKCASGTAETKTKDGFVADVKKMAQTQCGDTIKRCAGTYLDASDENNVWERIINGILFKDTFTDASDKTSYEQLYQCMVKQCGRQTQTELSAEAKAAAQTAIAAGQELPDNIDPTGNYELKLFQDCRNSKLLESQKPNCSEDLMRAARSDEIWAKFKQKTLSDWGYTVEECMEMVNGYLKSNCGTNYYDCRTGQIEGKKTAAMAEAVSKCDFENMVYSQNGEESNTNVPDQIWDSLKSLVVSQGDSEGQKRCTTEGSYYSNGNCTQDPNYVLCRDSGGKWDNAIRTCSCDNRDGYNLVSGRCTIMPTYTDCKSTGGEWNNTLKQCLCNGTGQQAVGTKCGAMPAFTDCIATSGSWNDSAKVCSCLNTGYALSGTRCEILPQYQQCVGSNGSWNNSARTCSCPTGYTLQGTSCVVSKEDNCKSSSGNWNGSSCSCPSGYATDSLSFCKATGNLTNCNASGGTWSGDKCACPVGHTTNAEGSCTKLSEYTNCTGTKGTWNDTNRTCSCPVGHSLASNGSCVAKEAYTKCTGSSGTWANEACTCVNGMKSDGSCKTSAEVAAERAKLEAELAMSAAAAKAAADAAAAIARAAQVVSNNRAWCALNGGSWTGTTCNFTVTSRGYERCGFLNLKSCYETRTRVYSAGSTMYCNKSYMGFSTNAYGCWLPNGVTVREGQYLSIPALPYR